MSQGRGFFSTSMFHRSNLFKKGNIVNNCYICIQREKNGACLHFLQLSNAKKKKSIKITFAVFHGKVSLSMTPKHNTSHSMSPGIKECESSISAIVWAVHNCQVTQTVTTKQQTAVLMCVNLSQSVLLPVPTEVL